MKALLLDDAGKYTWLAAPIGSRNRASHQLAVCKPVMAIGGFNGGDSSPTLARFEKEVSAGKVPYFLGGGGGSVGCGSAAAVRAVPTRPRGSAPGSSPTSPPGRWAAPRCTT
jgi:hypothetical protein